MAIILLVDDSPTVLSFSQEALEDDGHTIFTARNGIEANKIIFSQDKPDLILLDVMMPLLDGEKVVRAFRQSDISRNIPIVFFSTKSEDELKALVEKYETKGYIRKPVEADQLKSMVRQFLG